jgi:hypothetical protein
MAGAAGSDPWHGRTADGRLPVSVKSGAFSDATLFRDMRRWRGVWSCHLKRVAWHE